MSLGVKSFAYSFKISLICFTFILISVKVAIGEESHSHDYDEVIDTTLGMSKSITGFQEHSLIQCASRCTSLSSCKSFLWDPLGGICTLGSYVILNGVLTATGSKRLFTRRFKCRFDLGFELRQYGTVTRCFYIGGPIRGYFNAKDECHSRGWRLFKANTVDLLNLLQQSIDKSIAKNSVLYVGLDDRDEEGNFKWSDSQPLTAEERKQLFMKGEPNNFGSGQDCVELKVGHSRFYDTGCWGGVLVYYGCEMDI